jgi:hypothetical protein
LQCSVGLGRLSALCCVHDGSYATACCLSFCSVSLGNNDEVGRSLLLILNLTAASSLALCTASRHTPTRFHLCVAPFLHRYCGCPSSRNISHLSQTRQGCGSSVSSGFKSPTLRLFCKLMSCAIVLFKTIDYHQGKSSRSFFVRFTLEARYVAGDRDVLSIC